MQSVMRDDAFALQVGNEFRLHRRSCRRAKAKPCTTPTATVCLGSAALESVRQPIELSARSPWTSPDSTASDQPLTSLDRDGAAIGDAVLTLWFAFEGSLREGSLCLPNGAPAPAHTRVRCDAI